VPMVSRMAGFLIIISRLAANDMELIMVTGMPISKGQAWLSPVLQKTNDIIAHSQAVSAHNG